MFHTCEKSAFKVRTKAKEEDASNKEIWIVLLIIEMLMPILTFPMRERRKWTLQYITIHIQAQET